MKGDRKEREKKNTVSARELLGCRKKQLKKAENGFF